MNYLAKAAFVSAFISRLLTLKDSCCALWFVSYRAPDGGRDKVECKWARIVVESLKNLRVSFVLRSRLNPCDAMGWVNSCKMPVKSERST